MLYFYDPDTDDWGSGIDRSGYVEADSPPEDYKLAANQLKAYAYHGVNAGLDWLAVQKAIANEYTLRGWESLDEDEQRLCAQWFVTTPEQQASVLSAAQIAAASETYLDRSMEARQERWKRLRLLVFSELGSANGVAISNQIAGLKERYIETGYLEGVSVPGLRDYALSTGDYLGSGLIDSGYTPASMTIGELANACLAIVE